MKRNILSLGFIGTIAILSGCMVGPNFKSPPKPPFTQYTKEPLATKTVSTPLQGGDAQYFVQEELPQHWWRLFQSPEINLLVTTGLKNHPSLDASAAAVRQAQAAVKAQIGSRFFPQIDFSANASRQKPSAASTGSTTSSTDESSTSTRVSAYSLYNTQLNISYVLDIFGANRRAVEALCAQVDYQKYQYEGSSLSLSANIVLSAIAIADYADRIEATQKLIKLEEETLNIIRKQFELGGVAKIAVLNQESALAQLKATVPALELNLRQSQHALTQLIGEYPSQSTIPALKLTDLHLPPTLPVSIPSELVRHRPDIRAQEALLHQASANIGVATANLFPQITLTANAGWESLQLNQWFNSQNNLWNLAGGLLQPIFRGGALLAQRDEAIAAYEQALAQYKLTVLTAFQNVADALSAIEIDAVALKSFYEAELAAKEGYVLTEKQFQLGATTYLDLLTAKQNYNEAILNRVQAQAKRYSDTVALFQALGGAWWTT